MPTHSRAPASATSATPPAKRSNVERIIVWGGILGLLALVGYEYAVKQNYTKASEALTQALESTDKDTSKQKYITNQDVDRLLGRKPEFSGSPGQIFPLNSAYYEAYVWRSPLKQKFIAPPKEPEALDQFAIFTGEVRPQDVKYRNPDLDKNRSAKPSFFDAYVLYVYYAPEDAKTKTRDVIHVSPNREKYFDEVLHIPDAAELKIRHEANMARKIFDLEKGRDILTPQQIEQLDTWKHPELVVRPSNKVPVSEYLQSPKVPEVQKAKEPAGPPEKSASAPKAADEPKEKTSEEKQSTEKKPPEKSEKKS